MDVRLSEEQEALRDAARAFLARRYPPERVATIADGEGFDPAEWTDLTTLGWAEAGLLDQLVLAEELGDALYPGPFVSTIVAAGPVLRYAGEREAAERVSGGEAIVAVAWNGADGRFDLGAPAVWDPAPRTLGATRRPVADLPAAALVLVAGGDEDEPAMWLVETGAVGVARRELRAVDGTRRLGELRLDEAPARRLRLDGGRIETVRDRALAALAAEAVGVGRAALDLAVEHARTREQFGRPIGSFQAVAHLLADTYMEVETARSLAWWAGWQVEAGAAAAAPAAAAAKARAASVAARACERAIQVHGGIGFTWEHRLHRLYRRALGITAAMEIESALWARAAGALLDTDRSARSRISSA